MFRRGSTKSKPEDLGSKSDLSNIDEESVAGDSASQAGDRTKSDGTGTVMPICRWIH